MPEIQENSNDAAHKRSDFRKGNRPFFYKEKVI